jgi:hypothetical protein
VWAARRSFRTTGSSADPRAGQGAWPPAWPPATEHVTRPKPRPVCLPVLSARAPQRDLPGAVTMRDCGLGQGLAAPEQVCPCQALSSDLPAEATCHDGATGRGSEELGPVRPCPALSSDPPAGTTGYDEVPSQGSAVLAPVRPCPALSSDPPAGTTGYDEVPSRRSAVLMLAPARQSRRLNSNRPARAAMRDAGLGRNGASPRGLRCPESGRPACCRQSACLGALWPCLTSALLTTCGWSHCSSARAWPAVGQARPGRPRPPAAPP